MKDFIEQEQKLFEESFPSVESWSTGRSGDYTEAPLPSLIAFLSASHHRLIEKVIEMVEGMNKVIKKISDRDGTRIGDWVIEYKEGYNCALTDLIAKLKE